MNDTAPHPDNFANEFDTALAALQVRIETACAEQGDWATQIAAAIGAALAFAAADPAAAQVLINGALAAGRAGYARYARMLAYFGEGLLPGRALAAEGSQLPEALELAMVGGLAGLIAQRLAQDRAAELPALAAEAIQFVLTPYLGIEAASRAAAEHAL